MNRISDTSEWMLHDEKIRDGRYGPVFIGLRDSGELITAERLGSVGDAKSQQSLLSRLQENQNIPNGSHIVSYQGCEEKEEHIYILRELVPGGTLRDIINSYNALSLPMVRSIARQIVLGLEQLQEQGLVTVFLNLDCILIGNKGEIKIDAPVLDVTRSGHVLPRAVLTLPELTLGLGNLRKADMWLLGVVTVQLIQGTDDLAVSEITAQIKKSEGSAWEAFIPRVNRDEDTVDFLRQCFTINPEERPTVSELKEHPFLNSA